MKNNNIDNEKDFFSTTTNSVKKPTEILGDNEKFFVSVFNHHKDKCIRNHGVVNWQEFCEMLSTHKIINNKADAKLIVPGQFGSKMVECYATNHEYPHRVAENLINITALPLDFDGNGDMNIKDACEFWKDYSFILYTSVRHTTSGDDRFRMLIQLDKPMTGKDMEDKRDAIYAAMDKRVDESCLARGRGFYMPSAFADNIEDAKVIINDGIALDWSIFGTKPVYVPPPQIYKASDDGKKDKILKAMGKLSWPGGYCSHHKVVVIAGAMKASGYTYQQFNALVGAARPQGNDAYFLAQWKTSKQMNEGALVNMVREHGDPLFFKKQKEDIYTKDKVLKQVENDISAYKNKHNIN